MGDAPFTKPATLFLHVIPGNIALPLTQATEIELSRAYRERLRPINCRMASINRRMASINRRMPSIKRRMASNNLSTVSNNINILANLIIGFFYDELSYRQI